MLSSPTSFPRSPVGPLDAMPHPPARARGSYGPMHMSGSPPRTVRGRHTKKQTKRAFWWPVAKPPRRSRRGQQTPGELPGRGVAALRTAPRVHATARRLLLVCRWRQPPSRAQLCGRTATWRGLRVLNLPLCGQVPACRGLARWGRCARSAHAMRKPGGTLTKIKQKTSSVRDFGVLQAPTDGGWL